MVGNVPRFLRICELAPSAATSRFAVIVVVVVVSSLSLLLLLLCLSCRLMVNSIGDGDDDDEGWVICLTVAGEIRSTFGVFRNVSHRQETRGSSSITAPSIFSVSLLLLLLVFVSLLLDVGGRISL